MLPVCLTLVVGGPEVASAQDSLDSLLAAPPEGETGDREAEPAEEPERQASSPERQEEPATARSGQAPPVPERRRMIEEIIVTAQKREQTIQDVPISMSALDHEFLFEQAVTDVAEALQLVPNAAIDSAGFFVAPRIRGFSFNNNNKSFEPPVGIALDGIPYTRIPYFNAALFDVQRMEVLRGPQGTSFGKNTTAGLIHVISNKPTDELTGSVVAELGELNRRRLEAAIGGPVLSGLNFRLAGLLDERDGTIDNTTSAIIANAPDELKSRERKGLRATLLAPDLFGSQLELAYETVELFDGGAAIETISAGPNFQEAVRRYDPNADFIPGNWVASLDFPDFRDISIKTYRGQLERDVLGWSVIALGAHSVMEQTLSLDTDFTPAAAILGTGNDRSPTDYAEVRLVAPPLDGLFGLANLFGWDAGTSDFLAGVTWSKRQILDSDFVFGINNGPFFDLVTAAGLDSGGDASAIGGIVGALPINPTDTEASFDEFNQHFEQKADTVAVYTNMKWQFLPYLGLEFGGRFTHEEKQGFWDVDFTTPPPNPSLQAVGVEEFETTRRREENNFQPKISLGWQPLDSINVFAHWEQGFKGGGYNAFAFREGTDDIGFEEDDLEFEEEIATNWGLDFKSQLLDGAANLNVSLFRQTAEDFQVLIRENPPGTIGLGTSRVVNAEKARAQGVELDLTWLATDWLTVVGSMGLLDTEFIEFVDGECPVGVDDSDGDGNPACDQSGKEFPFSPMWSSALSLRAHYPLELVPGVGRLLPFDGIDLVAGTLIEYETSQLLDIDADERKRQDAFVRLGKMDVGLRDLGQGWSLRLVGENLTNTATHIRFGDLFENVIVGSQNPPRLFYMQFRYAF